MSDKALTYDDGKQNSNILRQAECLVLGDRNDSYGDPADDYSRTAAIWSGLLCGKLKEPITAREAIIMMAGMKLSREMHKPKTDSRIDIAGYALCLDWATTGIKPKKS